MRQEFLTKFLKDILVAMKTIKMKIYRWHVIWLTFISHGRHDFKIYKTVHDKVTSAGMSSCQLVQIQPLKVAEMGHTNQCFADII